MNAVDPVEVERALRLLHAPGDVFELRVPDARGVRYNGHADQRMATAFGFFDSTESAVASADALKDAQFQAAYITLNPVTPALLARSVNRIQPATKKGAGTSDKDISRRLWILIDGDPLRPSGISSTDEEHFLALELMKAVRSHLRELGWSEPILADSGNGWHLLYPIDLPADDGGLVKRVLEALALLFDTATVKVDTTVHNAARITKLYGTFVRKGDSTAERPHRMSRLVEMPETTTPVPQALLEEFVALAEAEKKPNPTPPTPSSRPGNFIFEAFMSTYFPDASRETWEGGGLYTLDPCPFNSDHTGTSAACGQKSDGTLWFKCQHNGCAGLGWKDLRAKYAPRQTRGTTPAPPHREEPPADAYEEARARCAPEAGNALAKPRALETFTASELGAMNLPEPRFACAGLIVEGLSFLAGAPKTGKSWMGLQLAIAVCLGQDFLGRECEKGPVLYLALEDSKRRAQVRIRKVLGHTTHPETLHVAFSCPRLNAGGVTQISEWLAVHPDARLVIIDTLARVKPQRGKNADVYAEDSAAGDQLQKLAIDSRVSLLVLTHTRKAEADDFLAEVTGSLGLTGSADSVLVLKRPRGEGEGVLKVTGRDIEEQEIAVLFTQENLWVNSGSGGRMSHERAEITEALRNGCGADGSSGMTPKQIAEAIGKNRGTVRRLLQGLRQEGHVRYGPKTGTYVPTFYSSTTTEHHEQRESSEQGEQGEQREQGEKGVAVHAVHEREGEGKTRPCPHPAGSSYRANLAGRSVVSCGACGGVLEDVA